MAQMIPILERRNRAISLKKVVDRLSLMDYSLLVQCIYNMAMNDGRFKNI
jgi:hypothetical protein